MGSSTALGLEGLAVRMGGSDYVAERLESAQVIYGTALLRNCIRSVVARVSHQCPQNGALACAVPVSVDRGLQQCFPGVSVLEESV